MVDSRCELRSDIDRDRWPCLSAVAEKVSSGVVH